jgi:hypothetical protein
MQTDGIGQGALPRIMDAAFNGKRVFTQAIINAQLKREGVMRTRFPIVAQNETNALGAKLLPLKSGA